MIQPIDAIVPRQHLASQQLAEHLQHLFADRPAVDEDHKRFVGSVLNNFQLMARFGGILRQANEGVLRAEEALGGVKGFGAAKGVESMMMFLIFIELIFKFCIFETFSNASLNVAFTLHLQD